VTSKSFGKSRKQKHKRTKGKGKKMKKSPHKIVRRTCGRDTAADTANLTATMPDANGTVTSNTLAVTFDNPNPYAGSGTSTTPDHTTTAWGSALAPITRSGSADTLYRDAANDECIAHHRQCERKAA
jgi:hypothetical protein